MSNAKIRAELEARLKTWADAQTIPIAFEGVPFTKPDVSYLECFLLPGPTLNKTVDGKRKTYIGIFQVNCWFKSGTGMGVGEKLSQSVIDLFPILPKIGSVSVEQTPSADKALPDNGWEIIPVTIKYRMETF